MKKTATKDGELTICGFTVKVKQGDVVTVNPSNKAILINGKVMGV